MIIKRKAKIIVSIIGILLYSTLLFYKFDLLSKGLAIFFSIIGVILMLIGSFSKTKEEIL